MSTLPQDSSLRRHSISTWMLLNIGLIITATLGLAAFSLISDAEIARLDSLAFREQDLVVALYNSIARTHEQMERCIKSPNESELSAFENYKKQLSAYLEEFSNFDRDEEMARTVTDFGFIIQSYLEEAENTLRFRQIGQLADANRSHEEAANTHELLIRQLPSVFAVTTVDTGSFKMRLDQVRREYLIIDIALSVLVCGFAGWLLLQSSRRIIGPIKELTAAAVKINKGDLKVRLPDLGSDYEMKNLTLAFNAMLDTINRQISELETASKLKALLHQEELKNQESQYLVKEAELQAMQSRINPHFLFNTLNMICQSAYTEHATTSAEMIESLAAMLHYFMENSAEPVEISDEIRYTRDYFHIQNLRFGGRVSFFVKCPPELESYKIPRLTIQPIVENAITHGVKDVLSEAMVAVTVRADGDIITIMIKDTGKGMPREQLARIRESINSEGIPKNEGIGLHNVSQRLRLFYGAGAKLTIESKPSVGTIVEVAFPKVPAGI